MTVCTILCPARYARRNVREACPELRRPLVEVACPLDDDSLPQASKQGLFLALPVARLLPLQVVPAWFQWQAQCGGPSSATGGYPIRSLSVHVL